MRQTLMVGESVVGFGNLPCATHRLMVDLPSDVSELTSLSRSSWMVVLLFMLLPLAIYKAQL